MTTSGAETRRLRTVLAIVLLVVAAGLLYWRLGSHDAPAPVPPAEQERAQKLREELRRQEEARPAAPEPVPAEEPGGRNARPPR